jgi:hypothetical protein
LIGASTFVLLMMIGVMVLLFQPNASQQLRAAATQAGFRLLPEFLAFLS